MEASDMGKTILFVRSILYDLGVPQEAATIAYEDNNACIAMANAQKPTSRTRHVDIRWFALSDWVERDLIVLHRVDTSQNMADHFTKQLGPILFRRHVDYVMGRVPPQYSSCFQRLYTQFREQQEHTPNNDPALPSLDTTHPTAAAAAKLVAAWSQIVGLFG